MVHQPVTEESARVETRKRAGPCVGIIQIRQIIASTTLTIVPHGNGAELRQRGLARLSTLAVRLPLESLLLRKLAQVVDHHGDHRDQQHDGDRGPVAEVAVGEELAVELGRDDSVPYWPPVITMTTSKIFSVKMAVVVVTVMMVPWI